MGRRLTEPLDDASVLLAEHTVEDGVMRRDLTRALSILPARQRALTLASFSGSVRRRPWRRRWSISLWRAIVKAQAVNDWLRSHVARLA